MGSYIPNTKAEQQEMLSAIGVDRMEALFADIPEQVLCKELLHLPAGQSEMEVRRTMTSLAAQNTVFDTILRGAGAYFHYIPAIVRTVTSKETFVTAYTPYQAEISQGVLQAIFEYQTMICELTDMEVSNASVYDGANAAAEAVAMCRERRRTVALVSETAHPDVIATIRTYCEAADTKMRVIPAKEGVLDQAALAQMLDDEVACVYVQQPNFLGTLEDAETIGNLTHSAGAKYILGCNPIALSIMKTPAACGADIAVGEGQPLGMPLSFGGPYLGFMAAKRTMMRKLPGRIVGQTTDVDGKRAYVLTLQAREQHIRREKASSNICSNEALCAMTASVYMSAMGARGIAEVARQCSAKAHYFQQALCAIPGFARVGTGDFFHEFVSTCPVDPEKLLSALAQRGILGGLPIVQGLLWCVTEQASRAQLDAVLAVIEEVCAQ